tara:strand:+ start:2095 stop:2226 length:132 start_codon:yes stop_codon:yes gene_type:complete
LILVKKTDNTEIIITQNMNKSLEEVQRILSEIKHGIEEETPFK